MMSFEFFGVSRFSNRYNLTFGSHVNGKCELYRSFAGTQMWQDWVSEQSSVQHAGEMLKIMRFLPVSLGAGNQETSKQHEDLPQRVSVKLQGFREPSPPELLRRTRAHIKPSENAPLQTYIRRVRSGAKRVVLLLLFNGLRQMERRTSPENEHLCHYHHIKHKKSFTWECCIKYRFLFWIYIFILFFLLGTKNYLKKLNHLKIHYNEVFWESSHVSRKKNS